jgi:hypothetical protein
MNFIKKIYNFCHFYLERFLLIQLKFFGKPKEVIKTKVPCLDKSRLCKVPCFGESRVQCILCSKYINVSLHEKHNCTMRKTNNCPKFNI